MVRQIKIRAEYVVFSVFALFLLIAGLNGEGGITGFAVKDSVNVWEIEFFTEGEVDLVIEMVEGEGYSEIDDVEFIELLCDGKDIIPNVLYNRISYEKYSCDGKSSVKFIVNSDGRFEQIIAYGGKVQNAVFVK